MDFLWIFFCVRLSDFFSDTWKFVRLSDFFPGLTDKFIFVRVFSDGRTKKYLSEFFSDGRTNSYLSDFFPDGRTHFKCVRLFFRTDGHSILFVRLFSDKQGTVSVRPTRSSDKIEKCPSVRLGIRTDGRTMSLSVDTFSNRTPWTFVIDSSTFFSEERSPDFESPLWRGSGLYFTNKKI